MIGLVQANIHQIIYHTIYFNLLKRQILEMETGEIEVVKHSMKLREEYQSILNTIFGGE